MKKLDLTGLRFGRLLIVKESLKRTNQNRPMWDCLCNCGKTTTSSTGHLTRKTKPLQSCGCLSKEVSSKVNIGNTYRRKAKGMSGFTTLYTKYKHSAKRRNIKFELTKEEFKNIVEQNCHYCGIEPQQIMTSSGMSITKEGIINSSYYYNGIDRKYSNIGYNLSNCISSCGICNKAKGEKSYEEFKNWIIRLIEYNLVSTT